MPKRACLAATADIAAKESDKELAALRNVTFDKYGATFVVRSGIRQAMTGADASHVAAIKFNDYDTALACYNSPEYRKAAETRDYAQARQIPVEGV